MINNKFIHIHIPRTGGQRVRGLINERRKQFNFLIRNSHMTLEESLAELKKNKPGLVVPSFAFIRNPWDWYVSRYFFRIKEAGKMGPHTHIETLGNNKEGFQEHLRILNKHIREGTPLPPVKGKNVPRIWRDLTLSKFFENMTHPGVDHICRFENFSQELSGILIKLAPHAFKKGQIEKKTRQKYNVSKHEPYANYYNMELKQMVYRWDKDFINRFGYKFGR